VAGINRNNPTPLYEQLKMIVRDQIVMGELTPGNLLPTEQSYCDQYEVSRITVSRAMSELEREGFIHRIQGKGSVVIGPRFNENLRSIKGFSRTMREAGNRPSSKILSIEEVSDSPEIANVFQLPRDQENKFLRIRRLRFVNEVPSVIMTTIVAYSLGLRMREHNLEEASFYNLYEEILGVPVIRNETQLTPITASPDVVELLKVKPGSPHFLFRGVSYIEGDVPVEICVAVFHGNVFQFSTEIYRLRNLESPDSKVEELLFSK